jgi:hypothetical protein
MATKPDASVKKTQEMLNSLGFNCGTPDGLWGPKSLGAYTSLLNATIDPSKPLGVRRVGWGQKFSAPALTRLAQMVKDLRCEPVSISTFMGCMAWETGRSLSPAEKNKISGATGLIQFMEPTAKGLGTSQAALAKMSVLEQLEYVYLHFKPFAGKLKNDGDVYMTILLPRAVGKADDYVLWDKSNYPTAFSQNKGLDLNDDGLITRTECMHKVRNLIVEGFLPNNVLVC